MALDADREIFEIARETEHVTFQATTRKAQSGFDLPMVLHDRLAFTPEEYVRRYDVIQSAMAAAGLDALLVRGPENITYLSGYETPGYYKYHCIVVPKDGEPVFLVRDFEWINTPEFAWSTRFAKVFDWDHPPSVTSNVLQQLGFTSAKRIGVEKQCFFYTVDEHETLVRDLPDNEYVDATQILWDARMIKSGEEIAVMRKSAHLVDLAMQAGWDATRPGASADEISGIVNKTLFENGGEYMGLPPFVSGFEHCARHV